MKIEKFEILHFELPKIEMRITDFVAKVVITGVEYILHIELQTYNDPEMVPRMLRYKAEFMRIFRLPVIQIVIYIWKEKLNMQSGIQESHALSHLDYRFTIIDLSSYEPDVFLKSDVPSVFILALLCKVPKEGRTNLVKEVLGKIKEKKGFEGNF